MTRTVACADGLHSACPGTCAKWQASREERVLDRTGEDGCAVVVACACVCHEGGAS